MPAAACSAKRLTAGGWRSISGHNSNGAAGGREQLRTGMAITKIWGSNARLAAKGGQKRDQINIHPIHPQKSTPKLAAAITL